MFNAKVYDNGRDISKLLSVGNRKAHDGIKGRVPQCHTAFGKADTRSPLPVDAE